MASSLVNNKYRITRRIGGGSFGEIYMGIGPNNEKVAVKFERQGTRCPQLRHEFKVYRELTGCHGFCQVYHFGVQDNYNVMVMDLLGPSLEDLFNKCNRRFSLKTVLQIADQMLERVDTLHSRHLIHRDIKPANFVIGVGETASTIFCVDFGLSKRYRHPKNLQHIPHRDGRSLTGTPRYASINNHLGIEQSRRDDLESIGYVLIYFLKGSLPWQGLKAKNAQKKYRYILEKKQLVSIAQLCQGCPSQFAEFLAYTRSLKFDAKPDIPYLRKLFRDLYHAQNCAAIPKVWDWEGMDNDYSSAAGSNAPGATPVLPLSNQPTGLRPTTAAAVVSNNGVVDSDLLLGVNGEKDDLDEDFDQRPMDRPNTAGAMLTSGYNRSSSAAAAAGGSNWGSGAPNGMKSGNDYAGVDGQARRPHTAHGARAGFPTSSAAGYSAAPSDPSKLSNGMYGEQEDGHVVAGAREMMRYRRNKASGMDGSWGGADPAPAQMNAGVASWAVYPNGKPTGAPQMVAQQQAGKAPTSGMGGWPFSDRPKSANIVGPGMNQSGGGLMPQGARPSSSNPTGSSLWQQQSAGVGSGKAPAGAPSTNTAGAASGTSSKSKLFSLAR